MASNSALGAGSCGPFQVGGGLRVWNRLHHGCYSIAKSKYASKYHLFWSPLLLYTTAKNIETPFELGEAGDLQPMIRALRPQISEKTSVCFLPPILQYAFYQCTQLTPVIYIGSTSANSQRELAYLTIVSYHWSSCPGPCSSRRTWNWCYYTVAVIIFFNMIIRITSCHSNVDT